MTQRFLPALGIVLSLLATTAHAQYEASGLNNRMERLERDLSSLQRQSARGGTTAGGAPGNAAQMTSELSRIEEEMRSIRGEIERSGYETQQVKRDFDSYKKDMEYRLQSLEAAGVNTSGVTGAPTAGGEPAVPGWSDEPTEPAKAESEKVAPPKAEELDPAEQRDRAAALDTESESGIAAPAIGAEPYPTGGEQALRTPGSNAPETARDLYNKAFRLLNQNDYAAAEGAFNQFTQNYSSDPLIGNAYYWLGETYYVRRNYDQATAAFKKGFEVMPNGPKAGDNLLKLAMSLSALDKKQDACVVLKQVDEKFGANSDALRSKTRQEIGRLGC